ncbi:MAG: hypothetical protein IKB76_01200 [Kiritimatiellae bacterium]|nr:hypothetical protein [Kiritimatiellia bacterium]
MKKHIVAIAIAFCAAASALAQVAFSVDNIFGDGMVVQRRKPVRVSGNAEPSLSVTATFRGEKRVAVAGADGRWTVEFPAGEAGGPFELKFVPGWEKGRSFVFTDILVGDVWVCSGQSNMSFPVWEGGHRFFRLPEGAKLARSAKDRRLRLFNGCRSIAVDGPCTDMTGRPRWMPADSYDAIAPFSAVGYLFGVKLRKALEDDIPIGMVHASWGGTMIEPWIPESAYARAGRTDVTTALAAYRFRPGDDPSAQTRSWRDAYDKIFRGWLARFYASAPEASAKALAEWGAVDLDTSDWKRGRRVQLDGLATPGIAWYRFEFKVPEEWADDELVFHLDAVNDADETFLDGVKIGETGPLTGVKEYWHAKRDYRFRATPGRHVAAVRAADHYGTGYVEEGVWVLNPRTNEKIDFTGGEWMEKVEFKADTKKIGIRPNPLGADANPRTGRDTPSALYNAMVHPVTQMNVAGVIWYQGCSNSGNPEGYPVLQRMLIDSWREAFRDPALPFVITQLSSLQTHTPEKRLSDDFWKEVSPEKLGFAPLRAAQEKFFTYPATGLACTIDLGDHSDIHPARKAEVADRLVSEALRIRYGRRDCRPGPRFASMTRRGDTLVISFRDAGKGVVAKNGAVHPRMFSVAGEDGAFVWAEAKANGDGTVSVRADGMAKPVKVRYAYWACPIFDGLVRADDGLPVFPFEATLYAEETVSAPAGTDEIQAAIDRVSSAGGGVVHVAKGDYPIACLRFRDNVTLDLAEGARLYGETNTLLRIAKGVGDEDNFAVALLVGKDVSNIALVGKGRVDGCGQAATPYANNRRGRWKLIVLENVRNFRVEDVTLENSATWTCYFHRCDGIVARGVRLDGHANYNNDGFDIEAKNVLIEDCDIDVEDDAICGKIHDPAFVSENVEVRNCRLASNCNFVKLGTASFGTYRNWYVHDCVFERCRVAPFEDLQWVRRKIPGVTEPVSGLAGVALEAVDGGRVENVVVCDIEMKSGVQTPIFLRVGARRGEGGNDWNMRNVLIENVVGASCSWIASSITGVPGRRIGGGITLRNVDLTLKGGITGDDWRKPVPEAEKSYPENRCFGTPLPAHGFYLRHADGVTFQNVNIRVDGEDPRPAYAEDDCTGVVVYP